MAATINPVITPQKCASGFGGPVFGFHFDWAGLANGDTGAPAAGTLTASDYIPWLDRTFQVTGTFGVGGTVVIEGTNDGTNWATLTSPNGVPLSFTAAGIGQVTEVVMQMRPRVTGGDGTTSLNVNAFYRRTFSE